MAVSSLADFTVIAPTRNHRGIRSPNPLKFVVIHSAVCCDGGTTGAEALARYLRDGAGGRRVSWHYSTDRDSIASSLPEDFSGRHTGSSYVDTHSIAIEMAVYVPGDWSKTSYKATLEKTAELTADICLRNNIAPEPLTASQLRADQSGIISHNLSRIVFGGTTHTDPGPEFPWGIFAERVLFYYKKFESKLPTQPGPGPIPEKPSTVILKLGSTGPRVGELQSYFKIRVDGEFGPSTEAAVKGFQLSQNLDTDGIVGPKTSERIDDPVSYYSLKSSSWLSESLYRGKKGNTCYKVLVGVWQERLGLVPTGNFDFRTEAVTLGFQAGVKGMAQDGIVGRQAWGTAMM